MYVCPKCEPAHPVGHGYSIAYCRDHTPERLPLPFEDEFGKWERQDLEFDDRGTP